MNNLAARSKGIGSKMKKKYKLTTLLTFSICFFTAMIIADVLFIHNNGMNKSERKVIAADRSETEQEEALETTSAFDLADGSNEEILSENVVEDTEEEVLARRSVADEEESAMSQDDEDVMDSLLAEADKDLDSETEETELMSITPVVTFDKVIPNVNESLNIRSEANAESEVVGKLYKESYAEILERGEEWTKIKSGDVTGYANNEYLYFDQDAMDEADRLLAFKVKITAGTVNIRSDAGTNSEILKEAKKNDEFVHLEEFDTEEWYAVQYGELGLAYVSAEYAEDIIDLDTAVSKEEEERIQREKEIAKALEEAKKYKPAKTNRAALEVSDEEIFLLATVVAMEAVGESYEGQLAVANVVVNRVLSGKWGDTIADVVYAPGQFSGANSGRVERFESRVTESCKKAAIEALAGNNNIGDYMFFIMKNKAKYSSYSKYYVLGCHCFYQR